jgi:serine/threonine protein kinase/tetratricopeptide (TPR) repeat protein
MAQESLDKLNIVLAGRYAIEREIAKGGMATVYLADDLRHNRKVAVKLLRPELASALGPDRFAREIAIAARLSHPHILALYDSGEAGDGLFYVMPYISGETLRQRLTREHQLPIDDAIGITQQIASALDYAHAQQLVHRDIKPENILLYEGEAMLADFGIALAPTAPTDERLTLFGLTLGTPQYMSPEQAAGETDLDARSDVYSLACVVFELLAGQPPFTGATQAAVIAKRFTEPAPSIRRTRANVPVAIDNALRKAMDRDPAARFPSCGAFAEALKRETQSAPRIPSVAVLPFVNLSNDPDNEFFADGITEDVIAQLSKIRSLKVISRASVMKFKKRDEGLREISAALEVGTVLDGTVRRAGDRVRIVAGLIDSDSGNSLWTETYDRQLTDIFAIQTDVALQIAGALEAELSPRERARLRREPTYNVQAYQLYLQGRFCYSRYTDEGMLKAVEYYRQAIDVDPRCASAYVGLAETYAEFAIGQGGGIIQPSEAHRLAKDAARRALAIDDELGEAHAVLALLKFIGDYDWKGAEAEFKVALELSPGSADIHDYYGWWASSQERYDEALEHVRRANELDPLAHRSDVASTLLRAGRYEEALATAKQSVDFEPNYGRARSSLGWAYMKTGNFDEGIKQLELAVSQNQQHTMYIAQLGEAYAVAGRTAEARAILRQLEQMSGERYVSPYHLAYVHTGLGDYERAIDLLEQAFADQSGSLYGVKGSFLFTPLKAHPRFQSLLKKLNLA